MDINQKLLYGISKGNLEQVKECLTQGANTNCENENGIKPLMIATTQGNLEIAKLLIDNGADVNVKDKNDNNALVYCSNYSYAKGIAKLLIDNGIEINNRNRDGVTALEKATNSNNFEMAKFLVESGADYKSINKSLVIVCGGSNWSWIKSNKDDEFLHYLISHNADVNTKNSIGTSALGNAVLVDNLEFTKTLLCNGADVNSKDIHGDTALNYACIKENWEITNLLIDNGANVNIKNNEGKTAFDLTKNKQIKSLLKQKMQIKPKIKAKSQSNDFGMNM